MFRCRGVESEAEIGGCEEMWKWRYCLLKLRFENRLFFWSSSLCWTHSSRVNRWAVSRNLTFRTVQLNSHRLKTVPPCLPAGLGSKYGDRRVSVNNCTKGVFSYGLQSSIVRILNSINISLVYCLSCKKPWREDRITTTVAVTCVTGKCKLMTRFWDKISKCYT